jgi:RNA-directed DNA polymerase
MAKNVLSLSYKDALDYFMSAPNYSTLELPEYLDMTSILKHVRKTIGAKTIEDCVECNSISTEALNYTMNLNKDGKYAIRPIALVNPYIYYFFAREVCSEDNWNYLKAWFKAVQQPAVTACSLLVIAEEKEAFHNSTTILNWWSNFEQASLELSLEYPYMFISDIRNCYGSINVNLISEALNDPINLQMNKQRKNFDQKRFVANVSKLLHYYQGNMLVGFPQGCVLSDFVAEILLAYADMLLCKEVQVRGIQCKYKVLRYRDDYRFFCEDKEALTELSYILQSVLRRLGFEMNSQKTQTTDDLISNSIKGDKLAYIYNTPIFNKKGCDFDGIQKHLLFIYQFGKEFPNSGQLKTLLSDLSQRIDDKLHPQTSTKDTKPKDNDDSLSQVELWDDLDDIAEELDELEQLGSAKEGIFKTLKTYNVSPIKENIRPIVAIATQIAIDNVSCSHYALRVISQLLSTCDADQKKEILTLVVNRLFKQPNNDYTQLWLQNMTYSMDKEAKKFPYTNDLCKIVMGEKANIWDLDWLKDELKQKFPITRLCNKKKLLESDSEIKFKQRENYTETAKVIRTL